MQTEKEVFIDLYNSLGPAGKFVYDNLGMWPNWKREITGEEIAKIAKTYAAQQKILNASPLDS